MSENLRTFDTANFEREVLESDQPVLVDFWAPWCGPCRAIGEVVHELADEFDGVARVGKVNIDDNPKLATDFGVTAIPTVFVFRGGEVAERLQGVQSKSVYAKALTAASMSAA